MGGRWGGGEKKDKVFLFKKRGRTIAAAGEKRGSCFGEGRGKGGKATDLWKAKKKGKSLRRGSGKLINPRERKKRSAPSSGRKKKKENVL